MIVRVRKLVVYLSSSQATSKTAKLPKRRGYHLTNKITNRGAAGRFFFVSGVRMTILKKITNRGAAGRFFFVSGVRVTIFVVPESGGIGRDRAGFGLQPSFASTPVQTPFRRVQARIGRDRAGSGCSPRLRAPLSRHRSGGVRARIGRDRAGSGGIGRNRAGSGGIGWNRAAAPSPHRISPGCVRKSPRPKNKTQNPPSPPQTQNTPPKNEEFYGHGGFSSRKTKQKFHRRFGDDRNHKGFFAKIRQNKNPTWSEGTNSSATGQ